MEWVTTAVGSHTTGGMEVFNSRQGPGDSGPHADPGYYLHLPSLARLAPAKCRMSSQDTSTTGF